MNIEFTKPVISGYRDLQNYGKCYLGQNQEEKKKILTFPADF